MIDVRAILPPGFRPSVAFVVSASCLGTIAVAAAVALVDLAPSAIAPSADPKDVRAFDAQLARHEAAIELSRSRFDGRSLFVMPAPPYRPPPPPPPMPPEPPPPPKPVAPVAPPEYSGPKPLGMIGGSVYFDSVPALSVGQERDGLKVLGVEPPSHVRVSHRGGTYRVAVWDSSDLTALSKREPGAASPVKSVGAAGQGAAGDAPDGGSGAATGNDRSRETRDSGAAASTPRTGAGNAPAAPATPPPTPPRAAPPAAPPSAPGGGAEPNDIGMPTPEVPPALSQSDVDAMSRREAQAALAAVSRARSIRDLDEATRTRLRADFDMLIKRVRTAPADEGR